MTGRTLHLVLFISFCVVSAMSLIMVKASDTYTYIRSGEHIRVSSLTEKNVKPSNNIFICDHLLQSNLLPSFDNFSVLAHQYKKYLLEIKENLLIMRDKR